MKIDTRYTGSFMAMGDIIKDNVDNVLKECGENVLKDARDNCPQRSGALKNSLKVKNGDTKTEIYSDAPYASAVEMGDSKQSPNPFLSNALYENETIIIDKLQYSFKER